MFYFASPFRLPSPSPLIPPGRGLHSNVLGFWGGISWNIAVARVCQLYPRAAPAVILEKFFRIYSRWCVCIPCHLWHPSR